MPELLQIPIWNDNYAYLAIEGTQAFVVDAPEPEPVLAALEARGLTLAAVVNTHHHPDHVGANLALKEATGCEIVGNAEDSDRIPGITREVRAGETIDVAGMKLRVLDVGGHTNGHVAYVLDAPVTRVTRHGHEGEPVAVERLANRPAIFIGDTIFMAGIGRLFEGTEQQMAASLKHVLEESPEVILCCAHKYTDSNLRFAQDALPANEAISQRMADLAGEREASGSSVPDTLARELLTNPFLLCFDPTWRPRLAERYSVPADDDAVVLGAVRAAKDCF